MRGRGPGLAAGEVEAILGHLSMQEAQAMGNRIRMAVCLAIGIALIIGCSTKPASKDAAAVWCHKTARVDFGAGGWEFFWGAEGEVGLPIQSFLHLYARRGRELVRISAPEDMNRLDGLVVRSADDALSYVRLFTEPTTFMSFESPGGIEREMEQVKTIQHNGFNVVRVLVLANQVDGKGHPVVRTEEGVSLDGKYTLVKKTVLRYVPSREAGLPVLE